MYHILQKVYAVVVHTQLTPRVIIICVAIPVRTYKHQIQSKNLPKYIHLEIKEHTEILLALESPNTWL